ncbi:tetratricopeptide repeat protein [Microbulbifer sp. OS29]|uniref:Tetratricopeptide repeat protein n=1 Tax=Microbulbifer okhotskensis TaxID=2926617 RepID=A0A9X2J504_9GAMM|nr:tetratricopeptide repeat protein [Microbulbifer okhotskensis]MCO1335097.1 tetratricopeptide repeat protein [Microbulbifer okhotskensis]
MTRDQLVLEYTPKLSTSLALSKDLVNLDDRKTGCHVIRRINTKSDPMPFLILSILIQAVFVVHVLKTGRNTTWIWILVMLPMAGVIAYLILEVLPKMNQSRSAQKARRTVREKLNPNRDIHQAAQELSRSNNVENAMRMADECVKRGLFHEARTLYERNLQGVHRDDPVLLVGLAQCQFALSQFESCKNTLDQLIEKNPDYKNQEAHLLYARSLAALGQEDKAHHEYETLYQYYSGPEAIFRFAKFLQLQGQEDKAKFLFQEILDKSKSLGKHYQSTHKKILQQAKLEVS